MTTALLWVVGPPLLLWLVWLIVRERSDHRGRGRLRAARQSPVRCLRGPRRRRSGAGGGTIARQPNAVA